MSITIRPKDNRPLLGSLRVGTLIEWDKKVHMVIGGHYPNTDIAQIDTGDERTRPCSTGVRVLRLVNATFEEKS